MNILIHNKATKKYPPLIELINEYEVHTKKAQTLLTIAYNLGYINALEKENEKYENK